MNVKNPVMAISASVLLIFSSCKKEISQSTESLQTETVASNATANEVVETAAPVWTSVVTNVNSNVAGFWQGVPARYNLTTKKYPLILFIHGIGELGTSLSKMNCCGLPSHLNRKTFPANFSVNGQNHSFIVIAPQFKVRPNADQMQSVIEYAKKRWRIDESRIYVTGLSMGGGSTWDYSAVHGQNAAAIVPVCGGTKPNTNLTTQIAAKNLPIWGLYSSADAVVPVQWGRDFFSGIDGKNTAFAAKTKLTIWTDASHNATWGRAFNPATKVDGYNIYEWMLLYKRGSSASAPVAAPAPVAEPVPTSSPATANAKPVARAGSDVTIYLNTGINRVTLDAAASSDADGRIGKYVWSKLSGPAGTLWVKNSTQTYAAHLVRGTYVFQLTVTDNKGAVATDTKTVYVK